MSFQFNRDTVVNHYLRFAFVYVIVIPASALVIWRGDVAVTDPFAPHIATQNMVLAVFYAFALICFKASRLPSPKDKHILIGFGGFMFLLCGLLIVLLYFATNSPTIGFLVSGLYYVTQGLLLLLSRWPLNSICNLGKVPARVIYALSQFPQRITTPRSPKIPSYFALLCGFLFAALLGLLQPGIGLAFRWLPYDNPAVLTPPESVIMGFFVPAMFYLFSHWYRLYDKNVILFTEFMSLMGFFHGFAMMVDSIAGTQGNINVHHILGGDVVLMWIIGFVFLIYHPAMNGQYMSVQIAQDDAGV